MIFIISDVSIAQAATIINITIAFVQYSLSLSLAILLIFFMPKVNSAIAWSSITRTLHSTLWPTIFRVDSNWDKGVGAKTVAIIHLSTITAILIPIAGITLPLGLHTGPLLPSSYRQMEAKYIPDSSVLGLATTSNRHEFRYGRVCLSKDTLLGASCPGKGDNPYNTVHAPSTIEIFNSTPYGPFSMQYRRFYNREERQNLSSGLLGTSQSFILRNDAFAIEGLIVDMSLEHPGIGFWNQTMPNLSNGGTWTQDVLWLEPATECVNTNLTAEYSLINGPVLLAERYNITDHGGFLGLSYDPPLLDRGGQHLNLTQHAYIGAVYSNSYVMRYFNTTRESSFNGKPYPTSLEGQKQIWNGRYPSTGHTYIKATRESPYTPKYDPTHYEPFPTTQMVAIPLGYPSSLSTINLMVICEGYGGGDIANISNVHVTCGGFLGAPMRIDGGDPKSFEDGSTWSQGIYVCASATRASIQRVTFSTNDTSQLQNVRVSRQPINSTVLWAVEKTNMMIQNIQLMWGQVDERFEGDPSVWMLRSDHLYLPAGSSSTSNDDILPSGQPLATHAVAWNAVYDVGNLIPPQPLGGGPNTVMDYTGSSDYAVQLRLQSIIEQNPIIGSAQVRNIIWTDIMANNIIGTPSSTTLSVAPYRKSIKYDFRFAIPGLILLAIWAPTFIIAIGLLATRLLTFCHMRMVLQHTSVGRVVVGSSALRVQGLGSEEGHRIFRPDPSMADSQCASSEALQAGKNSLKDKDEKRNWSATIGATPVALGLRRREIDSE